MASIRTRKAYEDYYKKVNLVEADYLWENGKSTDISTMEEGKKVMAPGTFKGKPIFEDGVLESLGQPSYKTPLRKGGTMIVRSKNWTAIIPGGFRGGPTTNGMNPVSFDVGGYSALMGLIHVIAIPEKRITNCVTITEEDVPLIKEGITLLETAFNILVDGYSDDIGSVRWQLSQSGEIKMKDGSVKSMQLKEEDFIEDCRKNFRSLLESPQEVMNRMKMSISCHADTMSSIRKLHLHGYSEGFRTVAWEKMEEKARELGYNKNTPIEEVINMAMSGETKRMKDKSLLSKF